MKATKLFLSIVTVTGSGDFPIDMLRYDSCVPNDSTDASKIEQHRHESREIRLRRYSVNPGLPTVARWNSFAWNVTNVVDSTGKQIREGRI